MTFNCKMDFSEIFYFYICYRKLVILSLCHITAGCFMSLLGAPNVLSMLFIITLFDIQNIGYYQNAHELR